MHRLRPRLSRVPARRARSSSRLDGTASASLDPDGDDDGKYEKKVMTIAHRERCIGCTACSKICRRVLHALGQEAAIA